MRGVENEHCKIGITELAWEDFLSCHTGLDQACLAFDTGRSDTL